MELFLLSTIIAALVALFIVIGYLRLWRRHNRIVLEQASTKTLLQEKLRQHDELRVVVQSQEQKIFDLQVLLAEKEKEFAALHSRLYSQGESYEEKISLLSAMRTEMKKDFELLSAKILEDKTARFSSTNHEFMTRLSQDLGQKINEFKDRIEKTYDTETRDRIGLRQEILQLKELNQKITAEAHSLTQALKGNHKQRGNWGEMILEKVLESSGLRIDKEFSVQPALRDDDGSLLRPDVIIHLPGERDIIIDSKVSLLAYSHFCELQSQGDEGAGKVLAQHVQALKTHVAQLSKKAYSDAKEVKSLDFVIMFVPIEPAYLTAIAAEEDLFSSSLRQGVILTGPSNLLITLRLVKQLWRNQDYGQNTQDMAKLASQIYDRFAQLLKKLDKLGDSLDKSQRYFSEVRNHLSSGKTNLLNHVEDLRKLGINPKKEIPQTYRNLISE